MKKNEIIELNGKEYTLELNRESAIRIEQYTNLQKTMREINKPLINYVDEIEKGTNPFENEIDFDLMEQEAENKLKNLHKIIENAFWIWLYPNHKLDKDEVSKIIAPYYETDEKMEFISKKYSELMEKSTEINQKYLEELKNLKAQTNK